MRRMGKIIDYMESEGWARLECAAWGMPPNIIHRAWYYVSGSLLMQASRLTWRRRKNSHAEKSV